MKNFLLAIIFTLLTSSNLCGQEVILIRHAEVSLDHSGWMSSKKAANYKEAYDTAPVHHFDPDTVLAKLPKRIADTIFVSGLSRSIVTGLKLFGDSARLVSLDILNEFEMHMLRLPLYLPYKAWTGFSRGMWLLGLKRQGTESHREARKRVKLVSNFIERQATEQKQVIMVSHGFLNRNIARELKKRGWTITQNNGKKNLGATILRKYP